MSTVPGFDGLSNLRPTDEANRNIDYADKLMRSFALQAQEYFHQELGFLSHQPARDYIEYLPEFLVNRDH